MSIEITKLDRVLRNIACFSCTGKEKVLALEFRQDDSTGGNTIFLCADCRAKLAAELAKSLGGLDERS